MSSPRTKSSVRQRIGNLIGRTTSQSGNDRTLPGKRDVPTEASMSPGYDSDMNTSTHSVSDNKRLSGGGSIKDPNTNKTAHPKNELIPQAYDHTHSNSNATVPPPPLAEDFSPVYQRWSTITRVLEPLFCKKEDRIQNPIGLLEVDIIEGFGLPASDFFVTSDPYCIATLTGYWSTGQEWPLSMRSYVKTPIINQTLYPKWNSSAKFYVPRSGAVLRLEIFDYDQATKDDPLGHVEIPLEALLNGKKIEPWIRLKLPAEFAYQLKKIRASKGHHEAENFHLDQVEDQQSYHKTNSWSKVRRMGEHACVHLSLRFDYAPLGLALTESLWPEDDYIPVVTKFTLERTLTEVFVLLRLIWPIIEFFTCEDESGIMDLWAWSKAYRSLAWLVGLCYLFKYQPRFIFSFLLLNIIYWSYLGYRKRLLELVKYRANIAVHKKFGGNDEVKTNDLRYYGLEASDFKTINTSPKMTPKSPSSPVKRQTSHDDTGTRTTSAGLSPLDVDAPLASPPSAPMPIGRFKSSSFIEPSHAMTHHSSDSNVKDGSTNKNKTSNNTNSSSKSSSKGSSHHTSSPHHGETVIVAGIPPSPSIHDLTSLMKKDKPLHPLLNHITDAMWNPKPPAYIGRPSEITHADQLYEQAKPINYDSDQENMENFAWCPEDDFIDCKFELGAATRKLLDELISLIKADWMDTVENLLIKINGILNTLNLLLDWRNPFKSLLIVKILGFLAILHLFIPFSYFLLILTLFLFIYYTPYYNYLIMAIMFPIFFPMRMKEITKLMSEENHEYNPSSFHELPSSPRTPRKSNNQENNNNGGNENHSNRGGFVRSPPSSSGSSTHRSNQKSFIGKMFSGSETNHSGDGGSSIHGSSSSVAGSNDGDHHGEIEIVSVKKDNIHPLLKPLLVPHIHLHEIKHRQEKEERSGGKRSISNSIGNSIGGFVYNPFAKKEY